MRKYLNRIRRIARTVQGKDFFEPTDLKVNCVHVGSDYGGWHIATDGLNSSSVIYSAGLGEDASFDVGVSKLLGADVHVFDPTPRSIAWAKSQGLPSAIKLYEVGIADYDGTASFAPPDNPANVSHSMVGKTQAGRSSLDLKVKRLVTLMQELGHLHIDVLKMDIEGAEYAVIADLAASTLRPRQVLVELHHRFPSVGVQKSKAAISQLRSIGYQLYKVSESGEEYSFVHRP